MDGFRQAVLASGSNVGAWMGFSGLTLGGLPSPFDAVASNRLIGPSGSHPLAAIGVEELVARSSRGLIGEITVNGPVRIGEALSGKLKVTAQKDIQARAATFRLVGCLITEQQRSREERDSNGRVTRSESWVEVDGRNFEELRFSQPALPTSLTAGQTFEVDFNLPAPRLGPVSAHMGSAALVWALDAQWDISMGGDERVSALVEVKQNIDYLRSGAVQLQQGAMFDSWQAGDATISVSPIPPVVAGSEIAVTVVWPGAGSGRGGRLELQVDVDAPNKLNRVVLWSMQIEPAALRTGTTVNIPIPSDAPATLADKGVRVNYVIRALVDRSFRSDLAVERSIAVM